MYTTRGYIYKSGMCHALMCKLPCIKYVKFDVSVMTTCESLNATDCIVSWCVRCDLPRECSRTRRACWLQAHYCSHKGRNAGPPMLLICSDYNIALGQYIEKLWITECPQINLNCIIMPSLRQTCSVAHLVLPMLRIVSAAILPSMCNSARCIKKRAKKFTA